jgi:hypothetical protein
MNPRLLFTLFATMHCAGLQAVEPAEFIAACARLSAATGTTPVQGKSGWLFFAPELRHLGAGKFWGDRAAAVSNASKSEYADPLPAILDFHEQLKSVGIELILVPVPAKALIYPDKLPGTFAGSGPRLDPHHQEFYALLRDAGINVVDLVPAFVADREPSLYCLRDTHWSGRACVIAARRIAAGLSSRPWLAGLSKQTFATEERETEITGDLARLANPDAPAKEKLRLRFVGTPTDPVPPDPQSPVLLLGDSHCLVFHDGGDMHTRGAGLPDQLAAELGFAVDLVAVRGSGATPARVNLLRKARADTDYLARKKAVIWCFSVREFTESAGWQKVPVVKR